MLHILILLQCAVCQPQNGHSALNLGIDLGMRLQYHLGYNGTLYSSERASNSDNETSTMQVINHKTVQYCQDHVDGVWFYLAKVFSALSLFLVFFNMFGNGTKNPWSNQVLMCSLIFAWLNMWWPGFSPNAAELQ